MKYDNILNNVKRIHFIGIGGSGMCPMAMILKSQGYEITGSDVYESDTLTRVKDFGIKVFMNHEASNVNNVELIVYTAAVKGDNPELVAAKELGIPAIERSVMLGILSRKYEDSIAVAGTHGKTSTTSMLTQIMVNGEKDPTAIIGGYLPFIKGNSRIGDSQLMICEACEYVDSFLQLNPAVSVILNVDADHLDYFKNLDNIKKSFNKFAKQTKRAIIVNGDDNNSLDCIKDVSGKDIITFGLSKTCDYRAYDIENYKSAFKKFKLEYKGEKICNIELSVPGVHNVQNALAAAAAAHYMGVKPCDIENGLKQFKGVHRRFEILGSVDGITVADDFAHHPTELKATLNCAMNMGFNNVWAVFQPHTYSRTAMLLDDFAKVLSIPDKLVMSEILAVRETNTYNIYTKDLADKIPGSVWFNTFEEITDYVVKNAKKGDLILTLGGGNVYVCANMIYKQLQAIK